MSKKTVSNGTVLKLSGRFSVEDASLFRDEIKLSIESGNGPVYLDFTELEFISSAAIGILVGTTLEMNQKNRFFGMFGVNRVIQDIFRMTGVESVLRIHENFQSIEDAARQFK